MGSKRGTIGHIRHEAKKKKNSLYWAERFTGEGVRGGEKGAWFNVPVSLKNETQKNNLSTTAC